MVKLFFSLVNSLYHLSRNQALGFYESKIVEMAFEDLLEEVCERYRWMRRIEFCDDTPYRKAWMDFIENGRVISFSHFHEIFCNLCQNSVGFLPFLVLLVLFLLVFDELKHPIVYVIFIRFH